MFRKTPRRIYTRTIATVLCCLFLWSMGFAQRDPLSLNCGLEQAAIGESSDGIIVLKVEGGVSPYSKFSISDANTTQTQAIEEEPVNGTTKIVISDLAAGQYTITVFDARGKTIECTIIVPERVFMEEGEECITLGEDFKDDEPCCYRWQVVGETTGEVISYDSETEVCPTEGTTYSVVVTDGLNVLDEKEFEVEECTIDVNIEPDPAILCERKIELKAIVNSDESVEYLWSNGETSESITVTETGEYSVIVTAGDKACKASITVADEEDTTSTKKTLEEQGFVCIPIEAEETPPGIGQGAEKSLNGATITLLEGQTSISQSDLSNLIDAFFNEGEFCSDEDTESFVTTSEDLCGESSVEERLEDLRNADTGVWMHILNGEEGCGCDCLMVGVAVAGEIKQFTEEEVNYLLELIASFDSGSIAIGGDFASLNDQAISALLGSMTDSFLDNTTDSSTSPASFIKKDKVFENSLCDGLDNAAIGLTPSGGGVSLQAGATPRFFSGISNVASDVDNSALTGFTDCDGIWRGVYKKCTRKDGSRKQCEECLTCGCEYVFLGYKNIYTGEYYQNELTLDANTTYDNVLVGEYDPDNGLYNLAIGSYQPNTNLNGSGAFNNDFSSTGDFMSNESIVYSTELDGISVASFTEGEDTALFNPFGKGGIIFKTKDEHGEDVWIYGEPDSATGGQTFIYSRWNCKLGIWESYTPTETNVQNMHVLNAIYCAALEIINGDADLPPFGSPQWHALLAVGGTIDVAGAGIIFDVADAFLHFVEGNYGEAAISIAATPPVLGVFFTSGKYVFKIGGQTIKRLVKFDRNTRQKYNADEIIKNLVKGQRQISSTPLDEDTATKLFNWLWDDENLDILKRFYDDPNFYKLLIRASDEGLDTAKLSDLFNDLRNNDDLFAAFVENPELIKAWNFLYDSPNIRKNLDNLNNMLTILKDENGFLAQWLAQGNTMEQFYDLINKSPKAAFLGELSRVENFAEFLEKIANKGKLTALHTRLVNRGCSKCIDFLNARGTIRKNTFNQLGDLSPTDFKALMDKYPQELRDKFMMVTGKPYDQLTAADLENITTAQWTEIFKGYEAHHLIPAKALDSDALSFYYQNGGTFDFNAQGLLLPQAIHGSHDAYTTAITNYLDTYFMTLDSLSDSQKIANMDMHLAEITECLHNFISNIMASMISMGTTLNTGTIVDNISDNCLPPS